VGFYLFHVQRAGRDRARSPRSITGRGTDLGYRLPLAGASTPAMRAVAALAAASAPS